MSKRGTGRRLAMQVLYQMDSGQTDLEQIMQMTFQTDEFQEDSVRFARQLIEGAWKNREEIDALIEKASQAWSLDRISMIDKVLMRVAIYEMKFSSEPVSVIINEALLLAKKYSEAEAFKFVNGILDQIAKQVRNV